MSPEVARNTEPAQLPDAAGFSNYDTDSPGITALPFDYSVDNHFKAVDIISELCGEPELHDSNQTEIQRFSNSITFLREWMQFSYAPRTTTFACQNESNNSKEKDVIGGISLPQFSAAVVPKKEQNGRTVTGSRSSKDFVMYVGGAVWALDWCHRVEGSSLDHIKSEFVAVAAHPPESSYHKIGAPLTGRGVIQIWCLLNVCTKEDVPSQVNKKPKLSTQKKERVKVTESSKLQRPRGRPRKKPLNEHVENNDSISQYVQPLAVEYPVDSSRLDPVERASANNNEQQRPRGEPNNNGRVKVTESSKLQRPRGRPRKKPLNEHVETIDSISQYVQPLAVEYPEDSSRLDPLERTFANNNEKVDNQDSGTKLEASVTADASLLTYSKCRKLKDSARKGDQVHNNVLHFCGRDGHTETLANIQGYGSCGLDSMRPNEDMTCINPSDTNSSNGYLPNDVALPRMMLCLAHNGKVAWDVKWRPINANDSESRHRMGYLAVLLGNGALEVWEVPFPRTIKLIYPSKQEGADPRFIKLEPVFRCSMLKFGDRQSIPLTMEWSTSSCHDMILAGCHDGVVALWKFSTSCSSTDTRPLLRFSADTVPIRAIAWAPFHGDPESTNVIATAGHKGLKFWDIRDPFHPLWDINPVQGAIYSLDWLPDPRCIIGSCDDGTLWFLSLMKSANDVPVTGKPFAGTQKQGLHTYSCSSFSIWSIQASRLTGRVAYCGEDGVALHFQLTTRAVETDRPSRNRPDHFICGSLMEEESALTVVSPLTNTPFLMKKPLNGCGDAPRTKCRPSVINQEKKAEEQTATCQASDEQHLAVRYGHDSGIHLVSDDPSTVQKKRKQAPKSKTSSKNKSKADQHDVENIQEGGSEKGHIGNEIEVFPPKIVAMHRVRWNMNKGSEKWLCYGGAAGLVRCQEVSAPGS